MPWGPLSASARRGRNARSFLSQKSTASSRTTRRLLVETLERRELLTAGPVEAVINLQGTNGDDTFEFAPGEVEGTWRVTLNGAISEYEADSIDLKFDGGEGKDSAILAGNDLADVVDLLPGQGTMTSGKYSVEIQQTETISVDAAGGANEARLHDSPGDDTLSAKPDSANLSGEGFENSVASVSQVRAYGKAGGHDVAFLHDDPDGPDRFLSGPNSGKLLGADFGIRTYAFSRVYVYATSGDDMADLDDRPGYRDKVVITPEVTKFNGSGGARRLFGFADVRVDATQGDRDVAKIYGDPAKTEVLTTDGNVVRLTGGNLAVRTRNFFETRAYSDDGIKDVAELRGTPAETDRYLLKPGYAKASGTNYRVRAYSFEQTTAHSEPNLGELLVFQGATGQKDTFTASANSARLLGPGYDNRAEGFASVYAFATPGDGDKARLFTDVDEQEYFEADPKVGVLRSENSHVQVRHFERVNAYAAPGSTDSAVMYTKEGAVNEFTGTPEASTLRGDNFVRQAIGFRFVHAYGDPYSKQVATLSDSSQDDTFVGTSEYGELSGPDYKTRVVSFYEVRATASSGGNDEALLYDTDGIDHLEADSSFARMTHEGAPRDFSVETNEFDRVRLHSSNDDDVKDVVPGSVQWNEPESATPSATVQSSRGRSDDEVPTESNAEADEQPNVLFISVDDLNDWVGVLGGHGAVQTPNLDRLAARGVTFSQAYCPAPLCNPSRSAVLTGYYPTTSGVYKNTEDWRVAVPDAVTLPELFRENGYETVGGGKILHWNDRAMWDEYYPRVSDPEPTAEVRQSDDNSTGILAWGPVNVPDEEMNDHRITSWAADYLHEQHDSPFFLAAGVFRPHVPLDVPQAYFDLYPLDQIVLPETLEGDLDDLPAAGRALAETDSLDVDLQEAGNREKVVQAYLASVTFADAQIGQLLDALESSEYADDTVVALWSDHGMHFGEKDHWKKGTLWEEATRVPLIVAGPGVAEPGSVSDHPVDLVNLYPTLADLCDLPVDQSLDGVSLRPLLENPQAEWDRPALMNFRDANAVRHQDWRYIRYGDGSEELYDHGTDPDEWTNLADDPIYLWVKEDLAAMLPDRMALETPKRLNSPLHWDTIGTDSIPEPIVSGKRLFYSEFDSSTGRELWTTDGYTPPTMVTDIYPGPGSSKPGELVDWNGVTYFRADDGVHGSELWRTDGTASGTRMVSDIRAGGESSDIAELVLADDKLYFRADDGLHGVELWCSDGSEAGTHQVLDIVAGESASYPRVLTAVGTNVFFQAYHPNTGAELWKSDGTANGTLLVADILPGTRSSIPRELTATGHGVFFQATDGVHGRELWFSAGTKESTQLVQDLHPGSTGSNPEQLTYDGAALYFVGSSARGRGLWQQGTSSSAKLLHLDAAQASTSAGISELTLVGSVLYFQSSDSVHGAEVWRTDGTELGTGMVRDLRPVGLGSEPVEFTATADGVVFAADDGSHGMELWSSDGTSDGTALLTDLFPGPRASAPRFLRKLGETLVVFATDGESPYRLWRIDDGVMQPVGDASP
jgi:iduronate 2-sulfatase